MPSFPALPQARGDAPRCVANLAFPEILVIWALRRFTCAAPATGSRTAAIAPELSRAVGLARLEETLAAFSEVAESLTETARLPQALSRIEDDRINATEEALLTALAAFQRDATAHAHAICEWCLLPKGRRRFMAATASLARALREAGQMIPYETPQPHSLTLNSDIDATRVLPSAADKAALQPAEQGLVTAVRLWVSAFRQQHDSLDAARRHFERQFNTSETLRGDRRSGGDAGLSLHAVLRNTTLAATRPVDVRCPTCPGLSPDEARLLAALAWLQRDLAEPVQDLLGDWLPPAALRLSLAPARGLARSLLTAEQILPLRDWDFAALAAAAHPPAAEAAPRKTADQVEPRASSAPTLH